MHMHDTHVNVCMWVCGAIGWDGAAGFDFKFYLLVLHKYVYIDVYMNAYIQGDTPEHKQI